MNLTKPQLIIIGAVGLLVIIFGLIIAGVLPGRQNAAKKKGPPPVTLEFWGVGDNGQGYESIFTDFKTARPEITINYKNFADENDYEAALLEGLAAGKGPDIFMVRNSGLAREVSKISAVPATKFSVLKLKQLFPKTVEKDFTSKGSIYALPLSVDTLALIYNRDLMNQAGIAVIPENWEDFQKIIPKIVKTDENKKITRAAAAIGGSENNIENASHLLYALMLQTGTQMTNANFNAASFNSKEGLAALKFYLEFSDPKKNSYTWDNAMLNSLDDFSQNQTAIIFNYQNSISDIKSRNSFIDIGVAPFPQPKSAVQSIAYANYWGYAVAKQSKNQNAAWDFIIAVATDEEKAKVYVSKTKKPPALLNLINFYQNDPDLNVFAKQALIASSWPQIDSQKTDQIFSQMIDSVIIDKMKPEDALNQAEDKVTELMGKKTF